MNPGLSIKFGMVMAGLLVASLAGPRAGRLSQSEAAAPKGAAADQEPATHQLYESSRIQFPAPPPAVLDVGSWCDSDGDIWAAYGGSVASLYDLAKRGARLPVSRISPDSKTVVQLQEGRLQGYDEVHRMDFYVDPRGQAYALMEAYKRDGEDKIGRRTNALVVKYKDDGTVDSVVKLDPPRGEGYFLAWKLAVFLDGNFLVAGTLSEDRRPREPLTALFTRAGAFVKPVTLPDDIRPEAPPTTPPTPASDQPSSARHTSGNPRDRTPTPAHLWLVDVQQGAMAGSLDGNVYLVRAASRPRLYVISAAGEVVRQFAITIPQPEMRVAAMSPTQGQGLLLELTNTSRAQNPQSHPLLALLSLDTGKITETYAMPAAGLLACVTPENEFLFLGTSQDNHLEVIKYTAR